MMTLKLERCCNYADGWGVIFNLSAAPIPLNSSQQLQRWRGRGFHHGALALALRRHGVNAKSDRL
eukprot:4814652-Pyramimonas_sp.AAC.1